MCKLLPSLRTESTTMWDSLYRFSTGRLAWFLMFLTTLGLELTALFFQHIMLLEPCVMCIYERVALFGIMGAALLGLCNPKQPAIRWSALVLWIYSAWQGLLLAWEHNQLQVNPSPFQTCDFMVRFPSWLPLNKWMPGIFEAYGDCAQDQWHWLGLTMPGWLIVVFAAYLIVAIVIALGMAIGKEKRSMWR